MRTEREANEMRKPTNPAHRLQQGWLRSEPKAWSRRAALRKLASPEALLRISGSGATARALHEIAPLLIGSVPTIVFTTRRIAIRRARREASQIRALMNEFGYDLYEACGRSGRRSADTFIVAHERRVGLRRQQLVSI